MHPSVPEDIEELLLRIDEQGTALGFWPLGENRPFAWRELDWKRGGDLEGARRDVRHMLELMESGRAAEIAVDPVTKRPLASQ